MLKGIPAILSPELLKVLCEMGHSDTIVIADGNFPAETIGKDAVVKMIDDEAGMNVTFFDYPRNSDYIPTLMNKMKEMIAQYSK